MQIVGVSFDEPETNEAWAKEHGMPFELWSDDTRALALTYEAATSQTQNTASRITVLLNAEGDLWLEYPQVSAGTHPAEVLADLQVLLGG